MPGQVNPTQAEAMLMVAIQIMASDLAVSMGGAEGNFELNAFRPILISRHVRQLPPVMMVTALSPIIGYDKAAAISTTPSTTTSP